MNNNKIVMEEIINAIKKEHTLTIITGPDDSGKTTLARKFEDVFNIIRKYETPKITPNVFGSAFIDNWNVFLKMTV
uniref:Uncharacterized protein n=1 Tax=viral metagenome TaxID=1070528 RepID=A0A6C0J5E9_9ZZZZ